MQSFSLAYGKGWLDFSFPDSIHVQQIAPGFVPGAVDPAAEVERAMDHPLGGINLDQFHNAKSAAIAEIGRASCRERV